jgi:hypothetical protein
MSDTAALSFLNVSDMYWPYNQCPEALCLKVRQSAAFAANVSLLLSSISTTGMDHSKSGTCGDAKTALIRSISSGVQIPNPSSNSLRVLQTGSGKTRNGMRNSIRNIGLDTLKRLLRKIVSVTLFGRDVSSPNHARSAGRMNESMGIMSLTARKTGTTFAGFVTCVTTLNTCRSN